MDALSSGTPDRSTTRKKKYLGRVWFFRDITEKKRAAEKIAALARTDSLTGLANRAAFLERLGLEFARARRGGNQFAVHYLDLDHFKDVNDTLGHPVGDELLRAVADRLKTCVRETDMVARFGGDEFAVLQDDISNVGNVETLAAKIGKVLAAPFDIDGNQIHTSASIGIVPYRSDVDGIDAMMMKADLALYRAKNEGRNQFRFHVAELDDAHANASCIGEELRHAVQHGEFELYYQPQVEVKSGRDSRDGSADTLEPSQARDDAADRLHPDRREDRKHRGDRRMGDRGRLPADQGLERSRHCAADRRGQSFQRAVQAGVATRSDRH